jgi:protease stability complex PrcB-like protein
MKRNAGSVSSVFRRSSRIGLRSGFEIVLLAVLAAACGGAGAHVSDTQNVSFTDHGTTQQSGYEGGARIAAATDPAGAGFGQLAPKEEGRLYLAVFAGSQRTGGYAIRVVRIDRAGETLTVRAMFTSPPPDALTIQVLTSPAHLVSIDRQSAPAARDVVLIDQSAAQRARGTVPQSQP